jgi:hypothetical protein
MARLIKDIAADFDALRVEDFEYGANGWQRLDELCDETRTVNDASLCAPVMFRTMERLDQSDLGSPGPLVHTIEACTGYEPFLAESLRRKPSRLSVWMVNRILNTHPPDADDWLLLLTASSEHPNASEQTKADALEFLAYQNRRS